VLELFPYFSKSTRLIKKHKTILLRNTARNEIQTVNEAAYATLSECGGDKTLQQIIMNALVRYQGTESSDVYIQKILAFFQNILQTENLLLSDFPVSCPVPIQDVSDHCYPDNVAFELTDFCNLHCMHCYRNSSPSKSDFADADRLLAAVEQLSHYGLRSVHLTGGEPSAHKDFVRILEGVLKLCPSVIVLSNGTLFGEKELDAFQRAEGRVTIQVDVDCANAAVHDRIRGMNGAFDAVTGFIRKAAARGISVETAMAVCADNLPYLEDTVKISADLGAVGITCTPVMPMGRGAGMPPLSESQTLELIQRLPELYKKYGGFVKQPEVSMESLEKRRNCGGGHTNITCSPSGNIRPCILLDPQKYVMGNLFEEAPETLFAKPVFRCFANLQAPNHETCGDCRYGQHCLGCFSKPLTMEESMKAEDPSFQCRFKTSLSFMEPSIVA